MSAITETEPGGEIVCIVDFSARPRVPGEAPIAGRRRSFHVGERVRLVGSFDKRTPEDNPTGSMAVFEPIDSDGRQYAATASYFVTVDCWDGLKDHFARSLVVSIDPAQADQPAYKLVPLERSRRRKA